MLKRILKLGVIGGGLNSSIGKAHFSALAMDGLFEISSGFFSRDKKTNERTIKSLSLNPNKNFPNLDSYLESKEINSVDAFLILSPTHMHYEHLEKIINLKKSIICEKPCCADLKEFKYIKKLVEKNKINFFITYNYLGYPIFLDIKKMLIEKSIGKIHRIDLNMLQQGLSNTKILKVKKWRLVDQKLPTIQLDLGVHLLSILFFFFPKIRINKIFCDVSKIKKLNLVHSLDAFIKLENDIFCKYSISKYRVGKRNELSFQIFGEKGSLSWTHLNPETLIKFDQFGTQQILDRNDETLKISKEKRYNRYTVGHPYGFIESMANIYQDIYSRLQSNKINQTSSLLSLSDE